VAEGARRRRDVNAGKSAHRLGQQLLRFSTPYAVPAAGFGNI